jgi:hypothetical protein
MAEAANTSTGSNGRTADIDPARKDWMLISMRGHLVDIAPKEKRRRPELFRPATIRS